MGWNLTSPQPLFPHPSSNTPGPAAPASPSQGWTEGHEGRDRAQAGGDKGLLSHSRHMQIEPGPARLPGQRQIRARRPGASTSPGLITQQGGHWGGLQHPAPTMGHSWGVERDSAGRDLHPPYGTGWGH